MTASHQLALEGANNLLFNVVQANPGERVLIVGEKGEHAHFDSEICNVVAEAAHTAGLNVRVLISEVGKSASDFPQAVSEAMRKADHTIFFSRLGDQVRFCPIPGSGTKTMCYALDADYLASEYCRIPNHINQRIYDRLMAKIMNASQFRITCTQGTELIGKLNETQCMNDNENALTDFAVNLFPLTIFPPVSCASMSGKLVLRDFITSSSTIIYDDSVYLLSCPITAIIENGMILRFEGDQQQCEALEKHFLRVAGIVGGEAMVINSWHTGIIPATWYKGRAEDDLEKWGSVSFASPRITHFHACGNDPGQIGINLFDATIAIDDEIIWRQGDYLLPNFADCVDVFANSPGWQRSFQHNGDLGITNLESCR